MLLSLLCWGSENKLEIFIKVKPYNINVFLALVKVLGSSGVESQDWHVDNRLNL